MRSPSGRTGRVDRPELIDLFGWDPALLAANLADIRRVNRWLGGTWLTLRALNRLAMDLRPGDDLAILDVGTGSADIPEAMMAWAVRRGLRPRVLATDVSESILRLASRSTVEMAVADGRYLPFGDSSFDLVTCSLLLHHLDPGGAVELLREMWRVARRGIIVNDLVRNRLAFLGTWLVCRLLSQNPLTRHDGPLSVRRSYTRDEILCLAGRAGVGPMVVAGSLGYRLALCSCKPSAR